ncbi:MAG: DUF1176 domain-containing protein [Rhizobiaceae bacterium]
MFRLSGIFIGFFLLMVLPATLLAGPGKQVRDWHVWCDDVLKCTMQTGNDNEVWGFGFIREPAANSEAELFLSTSLKPKRGSVIDIIMDGDEVNRFSLKTDKGAFEEGTWKFSGVNVENRIMNAMMTGNKLLLKIESSDGPRDVRLSLSGVTGSALFMDEVQDRIGNRDALQATGDGEPKDAVTRVMVLKSASDLPAEVLSFWKNDTDWCGEGSNDEDDLIADFGGIVITVEKGSQLFVLPCGLPGAYNLVQTVLAFSEESKRVRTVTFPIMGQKGPTITEHAFNTSWDDRKSTLSAFYKGRGLGDCGRRTVWHWEGGYYSNFELLEEYSKGECDGVYDDWPKLWPQK